MPSPDILCALALAAWLTAAVGFDVRQRRIPNALVASGMLCGLVVQSLAPQGSGLFEFWWGGLGAWQALLGLAAGLALFMPLYLLRALGAGDVKLLAMTGVWLGPWMLVQATLLTLLAGGLMAIVAMLLSRSSRQVLDNVRVMLTTTLVGAQAGKLAPLDAPASSGVRMPYALAIAAGVLARVGWMLAHSHA
jgi:prepilin peptidase CpaA